MKKLFVIPFLFSMTLGFVSCMDDSEPIYYFWDEPAVVENIESVKPVIKTPHGKFIVPGLAGKELSKGNLLWTSFHVDMDNQANKDSLVVTAFSYINVNEEKVALPEGTEKFNEFLTDDYSNSLKLAELYNSYIDRYLFFGFYHDDSSTNYIYELVCNPEKEASNGYPTLYIRAKKNAETNPSASGSGDKKNRVIAAFDMTEFLEKYGKEDSNGVKSVKFNLKYKIGTDSNNKDTYREFVSNPINWSTK